MLRLNLLLLAAVMASALFLVHTQYEARRLFTERERAQHEARELTTEYQRLQVEKRAQATPLRIERIQPVIDGRVLLCHAPLPALGIGEFRDDRFEYVLLERVGGEIGRAHV